MVPSVVWLRKPLFSVCIAYTLVVSSLVEAHDNFQLVTSTPPLTFLLEHDDGFAHAANMTTFNGISRVPTLPSICKLRHDHDRIPVADVNEASFVGYRQDPTARKRRIGKRLLVRRIGVNARHILASSPWAIHFLKLCTRLIPFVGVAFTVLSKLLLPLYFARRLYQWLYTVGQDWYTGRYLRTTFERMHTQYHKRYRIPECSRSIGRLALHLLILFGLGDLMEWLIGLSHPPCTSEHYGGCQLWCACLWMVAVMGTGHAAGVALAVWGGYLRIQVEDNPKRPSGRRIVTRPWRLLRWMVDPDQWFREIIAHDRHSLKPFNPEAMMFPATWSALRIMFLGAVALVMRGDCNMHVLMRKALTHQALSDEWYRVLMCEKRVAWGIFIVAWVRD